MVQPEEHKDTSEEVSTDQEENDADAEDSPDPDDVIEVSLMVYSSGVLSL